MRIALVIAATSLCLIAAGPALADEPPGGAPPQASTYAPEGGTTTAGPSEEVICKDIKQLGSRLQSNRVCMTRADWEVSEKKAKETTETWQRNGAPQRGH